MVTRVLSRREEDIVQLCIDGFSNNGIAKELGLSVGTVNTYWLRIKLKLGSAGRTDTVAKIIKDRAERALIEANVERIEISKLIAEKEQEANECRALLALLKLAMDQIKSTAWAADMDLNIQYTSNCELPSTHSEVTSHVGKSVYDIFGTKDPNNTAVAAHLMALAGNESNLRLSGEFSNMFLRVIPLRDDFGEVMGCISILNHVNTPLMKL